MILISSYYISENEKRNDEIKKCLEKNYENNYISKIYLLNDMIYDLSFVKDLNKKIIQVIISEENNYKLKFSDSIKYINDNLEGEICILSNSDIYFDNTLSKINDSNISNIFFALLRYDEDENGKKNIFKNFDTPRNNSQDSWIFKSPLNIDFNKIDFSFGTLGCDSIFLFNVYDTGLKISNPSLDIVTTHLHNSEFRTYNIDERIHGKYCLIDPSLLNKEPKIEIIDY